MAVTVNIYYKGKDGNARKFAEEMISSGTVEQIENEAGNIRYEYFFPLSDPETVLLIDSWRSEKDIDLHHKSPMMKKIIELREKYDLHMTVEKYVSQDDISEEDEKYIRK